MQVQIVLQDNHKHERGEMVMKNLRVTFESKRGKVGIWLAILLVVILFVVLISAWLIVKNNRATEESQIENLEGVNLNPSTGGTEQLIQTDQPEESDQSDQTEDSNLIDPIDKPDEDKSKIHSIENFEQKEKNIKVYDIEVQKNGEHATLKYKVVNESNKTIARVEMIVEVFDENEEHIQKFAEGVLDLVPNIPKENSTLIYSNADEIKNVKININQIYETLDEETNDEGGVIHE